MQRRARFSIRGAVALVAAAAFLGGARAARAEVLLAKAAPDDPEALFPKPRGGDEKASRLPRLPPQLREDCWLRAPPGEPEVPCEIFFGAARGLPDDRAVLVRERGGAGRRGIAIQIRGSHVAVVGAGRPVGSLGADLRWIKSWTVLRKLDPDRGLDRDALLLTPAVPPNSGKLPASVILVGPQEASYLRNLHSRDGAFAAIGLADRRRRFVALDLLERYDVTPAKAALLPGLDDPDELVRLAVAAVLGASKVADAAPTIASWLGPEARPDVSPFTRRQIAFALGHLKSPAGVPGLERALVDSAPEVRQAAVWALGEIGGQAAAPLVVARVEDADPRVRREAAAKLRLFKDTDLVPAFRKAFADPDARTRLAAVQAAGPLELRALVPSFIERLHDPDDEVQYAAVLAVAKLHPREAAPHLVPLLTARGARIKRHHALCFEPGVWQPLNCAAAKALRKIGDPAGLAEANKLVPHCLAQPDFDK